MTSDPSPIAYSWRDQLWLLPLRWRMLVRELRVKQRADLRVHDAIETAPPSSQHASPWSRIGRLLRRARNGWAFVKRMSVLNTELIDRGTNLLRQLVEQGKKEAVIYGEGDAANLLRDLAPRHKLRIAAQVPIVGSSSPTSPDSDACWTVEKLRGWSGPILIAAWTNPRRHMARLQSLGISPTRLYFLTNPEPIRRVS